MNLDKSGGAVAISPVLCLLAFFLLDEAPVTSKRHLIKEKTFCFYMNHGHLLL